MATIRTDRFSGTPSVKTTPRIANFLQLQDGTLLLLQTGEELELQDIVIAANSTARLP